MVTDQCGAAEWVVPGETGWVVPAGSVDALADALEVAIAGRTELAGMGRRARLEIEARDPWSALVALSQLARD